MDSATGKQSERINHVEALDGVVKATLGCPCETIFSAAFNSTLLFDVRFGPFGDFGDFSAPAPPFSHAQHADEKLACLS